MLLLGTCGAIISLSEATEPTGGYTIKSATQCSATPTVIFSAAESITALGGWQRHTCENNLPVVTNRWEMADVRPLIMVLTIQHHDMTGTEKYRQTPIVCTIQLKSQMITSLPTVINIYFTTGAVMQKVLQDGIAYNSCQNVLKAINTAKVFGVR